MDFIDSLTIALVVAAILWAVRTLGGILSGKQGEKVGSLIEGMRDRDARLYLRAAADRSERTSQQSGFSALLLGIVAIVSYPERIAWTIIAGVMAALLYGASVWLLWDAMPTRKADLRVFEEGVRKRAFPEPEDEPPLPSDGGEGH